MGGGCGGVGVWLREKGRGLLVGLIGVLVEVLIEVSSGDIVRGGKSE